MMKKVSNFQYLSCFFFPPVKDMYDYQGRSYLHIPQDVGVSLRSSDAPDKCYLPKKQLHVWSGHTKVSVFYIFIFFFFRNSMQIFNLHNGNTISTVSL